MQNWNRLDNECTQSKSLFVTSKMEYLLTNSVQDRVQQMERLRELIQQRSVIERKMIASTRKLEAAYLMAAKALISALGSRLEKLPGRIETTDA